MSPVQFAKAGNNRIRDALDFAATLAILKAAELRCRKLDDYYDLIQTLRGFGNLATLSAIQRQYEINTLLSEASKLPITLACEIGTSYGGTFYLMCKAAEPCATLITIDLRDDWQRALLLTSYAKLRQKVHVLAGDSNDQLTVKRVTDILGKRKLDFLFIDGDHTYQGVSGDFASYSHFVRPGGLIAFHDIIPDFKTKFGIETGSFSGDVPLFWQKIRTFYPCFEIVESYDQDAYGIGVIRWQEPRPSHARK